MTTDQRSLANKTYYDPEALIDSLDSFDDSETVSARQKPRIE